MLYGREDKGLPNEALDLCHRVVTIPTNAAYPSLNLAHAVVLTLYELALARGKKLHDKRETERARTAESEARDAIRASKARER